MSRNVHCLYNKEEQSHTFVINADKIPFSPPLSVARDVSFYGSIKLHSKTMDAIIAVSKYIGN